MRTRSTEFIGRTVFTLAYLLAPVAVGTPTWGSVVAGLALVGVWTVASTSERRLVGHRRVVPASAASARAGGVRAT
jgi:hypothetical protein